MPELSYIVLDIYQFELSLPYTAGHVLTETEASVLNWHRAELIQKIAYRWLHQIKHPNDKSILSFHEIDLLQERITHLDSEYHLAPRHAPAQSYLDKHLEGMARRFLDRTGEAPTPERIRELKRSPVIRDLTRRLIENRFGDTPEDFSI